MEAKSLKEEVAFCDPHAGSLWPKGSPAPMSFCPIDACLLLSLAPVSPPSLLPSVETVNDGQFHSVELVMLNQTLNLVVDKGAPKSLGKLQKQPAVSINSPLYLGGKPHLLPPVPCTLVPTPRPTGGAHSSHLSTHCQSQSRDASVVLQDCLCSIFPSIRVFSNELALHIR